MRRAVAALDPAPGFVLTDGFAVDGLGCQSTAVIGGDAVAASIAAASVLAKVTRDRIMVDLDARYPGYGFAAHKGYGTARHARASVGPSDIHHVVCQRPSRRAQAFGHEMSAEDRRTTRPRWNLALPRYRDIVGSSPMSSDGAPLPHGGTHRVGGRYFDVRMSDAWVWDMYRPAFREVCAGADVQDVNIRLDSPYVFRIAFGPVFSTVSFLPQTALARPVHRGSGRYPCVPRGRTDRDAGRAGDGRTTDAGRRLAVDRIGGRNRTSGESTRSRC